MGKPGDRVVEGEERCDGGVGCARGEFNVPLITFARGGWPTVCIGGGAIAGLCRAAECCRFNIAFCIGMF